MTGGSAFVPLARDRVEKLNEYANAVLARLRSRDPERGFDQASVEALSRDLDENHRSYSADPEARKRLPWLFGAFLGKAIAETWLRGVDNWVDNGDNNYGLAYKLGDGQVTFIAPFDRVQKHLEYGPEYSIHAFFHAVGESIRAGGPGALLDSEARPHMLRVVVQTAQYVQRTESQWPPGSPRVPAFPVAPGLVAIPMVRVSPTVSRSLQPGDPAKLGMPVVEVLKTAVSNTRAALTPLMQVAGPAPAKQIGELSGEPDVACRLAMHDMWEPLAKAQGGRLIVVAPRTDLLLYISDDAPRAIEGLRQAAREEMQGKPNALSDIAMRWTPANWMPIQ